MVADDEYHVLKHLKKGYTMPKYEHVMIARQDLSNMQAEGLVEHFSKVLAENDGNVLDTEYWGLKTMAYKVNKNRKGHYAFIKSEASASAVQEMERLMRLHEDVMRVMTIKVKTHEEGPSAMMGSKQRHREDKPESTPVDDSKSKSGDE
jgi:small subunit ribosomal protein S6